MKAKNACVWVQKELNSELARYQVSMDCQDCAIMTERTIPFTIKNYHTTICHTAFETADDGTDFVCFSYLTTWEN